MRLGAQHVGRMPAPTRIVEERAGERDHIRGSFSENLFGLTRVRDEADSEIARGLCNYSSEDAGRLCGKPTDQIASLLGSIPYSELVHRDNLVVIG